MQEFLMTQAPHAYWIVFGLLVLAGFNLPISEDILVLTGGYLASTYQQDAYTTKMFMAIFVGAFCGDSILFGIGRHVGPPLLETKFFAKLLPPERQEQIQVYFQKYGAWTMFGGRFIPFGVRNGVMISAAIGDVRYSRFLLYDSLSLAISSSLMFWLGYHYAGNLGLVITYIRRSYIVLIVLIALFVLFFLIRHRLRKKSSSENILK